MLKNSKRCGRRQPRRMKGDEFEGEQGRRRDRQSQDRRARSDEEEKSLGRGICEGAGKTQRVRVSRPGRAAGERREGEQPVSHKDPLCLVPLKQTSLFSIRVFTSSGEQYKPFSITGT